MLASRALRCNPRLILCRAATTTSSATVLRSQQANTHAQSLASRELFIKNSISVFSLQTSSFGLIALGAEVRGLSSGARTSFGFTHNSRQDLENANAHIRTKIPDVQSASQVSIDNKTVHVGGKRIPDVWLRDNCQCDACVHSSTKQRLLDTFSIPGYIKISKIELDSNDMLSVDWPDGHQSKYTREFLSGVARNAEQKSVIRQGLTDLTLWDASIKESAPRISSTPALDIRAVLQNIREYGFCYVEGVEHPNPSATEALLKSIAFIRETHYGGFYDFTADLASKDTAYTNIALEAHTDTTYFSDPAGLQAFHLLSHTDGSGGASLLVDGFKVAEELLHIDKEAYEVLSTVNVHGHASGNDGISIQPYKGFPVLEHDSSTGDLLRVRWNSSDRAAIELPIDQVETWYDAARKFDALLKKKENEYWEQLTPGRVLIFDNWRVLHGRSKFTGKRRICGGYINRDDWISRYKMEEFGSDKVMGDLALG